MFSLYLTDPKTNMLFGFTLQQAVMRDPETGEVKGETDIFSIGIFFARLDIFFNEEYEDEITETED